MFLNMIINSTAHAISLKVRLYLLLVICHREIILFIKSYKSEVKPSNDTLHRAFKLYFTQKEQLRFRKIDFMQD